MFWVVQENLYNEQGQRDLLAALDRGEIPHLVVKFLPFLRRLVPSDVDINLIDDVENYPEPEFPTGTGNVMVCGAIALARVATERGWVPGSFINDNFHTAKWQENLGSENLLNGDAVIMPLSRVIDYCIEHEYNSVFIRPCDDDKAFTGVLLRHHMEIDNCVMNWLQEAADTGRFTQDVEVVLASPKEIHGEFRFFVVDRKVVTGSRYRLGGQVIYSEEIPPHVQEFAQQMVDKWQPSRAFVIDIAETPEGPKVIEINNFNSAGFYACNVGKIVEAIESMVI